MICEQVCLLFISLLREAMTEAEEGSDEAAEGEAENTDPRGRESLISSPS